MLFMGVIAGIGGILAFGLPETLGAPFVEKVEDIDILFQSKKPLLSWWSSQKLKEVQQQNAEAQRARLKESKFSGEI